MVWHKGKHSNIPSCFVIPKPIKFTALQYNAKQVVSAVRRQLLSSTIMMVSYKNCNRMSTASTDSIDSIDQLQNKLLLAQG